MTSPKPPDLTALEKAAHEACPEFSDDSENCCPYGGQPSHVSGVCHWPGHAALDALVAGYREALRDMQADANEARMQLINVRLNTSKR